MFDKDLVDDNGVYTMKMVDEGYVKITYPPGYIDENTVVEPEIPATQEGTASANQIIFDFATSYTGSNIIFWTFKVDNAQVCDDVDETNIVIEYCTGTSPTEGAPTFSASSFSDSSQCEPVSFAVEEVCHFFIF